MASFLLRNKKSKNELLFINEDISFSSTNDMISNYKQLLEENKSINEELDNLKKDNEYLVKNNEKLRNLSMENHYPIEEYEYENELPNDEQVFEEEDYAEVFEENQKYKPLNTYTDLNEEEFQILKKDFLSILKEYLTTIPNLLSRKERVHMFTNMFNYIFKIITGTKFLEKDKFYEEFVHNRNFNIIEAWYMKIEEFINDDELKEFEELNEICLKVKQVLDDKTRKH